MAVRKSRTADPTLSYQDHLGPPSVLRTEVPHESRKHLAEHLFVWLCGSYAYGGPGTTGYVQRAATSVHPDPHQRPDDCVFTQPRPVRDLDFAPKRTARTTAAAIPKRPDGLPFGVESAWAQLSRRPSARAFSRRSGMVFNPTRSAAAIKVHRATRISGKVPVEALLERFQLWPSVARKRRYRPLDGPLVAMSSDSRRDISISASPPVSDEELLRLYRRGDQDAFRKLYERHRGPLMRFVRRTAFDLSDTEEVIQETWMAVIRGRERYVPNARFVTYLFSIARRRGMDRWRRRGSHPELEDADALERVPAPARTQPESLLGAEALAGAVAAALEALPILQRETFLLRAETDLTLDEIAHVTGTTRETAKSRLRYALSRLRAALEPWT
jgi:RNA polymerase sigma factor (sigma-70 family)